MRKTNTQIPIEVLGNNAGYYVDIANKNSDSEFFVSWNWASFFFSTIWLIYRRCYLGAIVSMVVISMLSTPLALIATIIDPTSFVVSTIFSWLPYLLFGLFGNSIYFYFIKSKIERLENVGFDEKYIAEKCSPSAIPVVVYFGILIALAILFILFMVTIYMTFKTIV